MATASRAIMNATFALSLLTAGVLAACDLITAPHRIRPHDLTLLAEQPSAGGVPNSWCAVGLRFDGPDRLPVPYSAVALGYVMRRVLTPTSETLKSLTLDSVSVQVARVGSDTIVYLTGAYSDTLNISGPDPLWYCTEKVPFARDSTLKAVGYPDPWTAIGHIRYTLAPIPVSPPL